MIKRAQHVTRRWWGSYEPDQKTWVHGKGNLHAVKYIDHTGPDQQATRIADYLAVCSCYSCGNPRRHHGFTVHSIRSEALTMQEKRSIVTLREWEEEMDQ